MDRSAGAMDDETPEAETPEAVRAERDALRVRLAAAEELLDLVVARADFDRANDAMWTKVVGDVYTPADSGISIRHIHPAHVRPVFDAVRGTATADVIAGLIFRGMVTSNNAKHAWERSFESGRRADDLERRLLALGQPIDG